jgi:hypothetical protein
LQSDALFNSDITLKPITSITVGNNFLNGCSVFDKEINFTMNGNKIQDGFLYGCTAFNQNLTIPNTITQIGNNFLRDCKAFDKTLSLTNIGSIGESFLQGCSTFDNDDTTLSLNSSSFTNVSKSFLQNCSAFNQVLEMPYVESIGDNFLRSCLKFNQKLTVFENLNLKTIGENVVSYCSLFNNNENQIAFGSSLTKISNGFLRDCVVFNQKILLPYSITDIGYYFL